MRFYDRLSNIKYNLKSNKEPTMTQNPMLSGDRFRLGTFSTNCSSGMTPTKIAERWDNSWDNNLMLAKICLLYTSRCV